MPPRFTTRHETGKVDSPGCSNTMSTSLPLPVISQMALPNLRASLVQASYSGVPTLGIWPQQLKFLLVMTDLAPSDKTKSVLLPSEITPIALAPDTAQSCTANEPN